MRKAEDIANYVKRNRYGNFMKEDTLKERFKAVQEALFPEESVYSAFVGTVYGLPKHFVALTNERLLIYSLEKKKPRMHIYDIEDLKISLNDMYKGIIRFETESEMREVRAEPCYSKRIALELLDTQERMKNKKGAR